MKKIIINFLILVTCIFFTACQESSVEPAAVKASFFSSSKNREAFTESFKAHFTQKADALRKSSNAKSNGAQFIVPLFSSSFDGVGAINPTTGDFQFAFFSGQLSGSDFYRENPDGTVTVHVNMNTALAEYTKGNFYTGEGFDYLYGNNAHYSATYTGPVVEEKFYDDDGNLVFSYKYIDVYSNPERALSIKGNGKVGENGEAPMKVLSFKVIRASSGQSLYDFSLK